MEIAQKLAGYTLGNADLLRRAMGKKKKEVLDKEYVPFSDGMKANGYSQQSIQTLLSYPLRKEGYDVVQATDGRQALDRFDEQPFDLVVLDLMLPKVDGLEVCRRFPDLAAAGRLAVRLDTHGGRFVEGLDPAESYAALERHVPGAIRRYRSDAELRHLVGTGVSAAAIWRMREALDDAGFENVRIVASSGFGVDKCRVMADARAPIDVVGTGSFIPDRWSETYATADIVAYDGVARVKVGREFLLRRNDGRKRNGG